MYQIHIQSAVSLKNNAQCKCWLWLSFIHDNL